MQNLDTFTGEQKLVDLLMAKPNVSVCFGTTVKEFVGEDALRGVVVTDTHTGEEKTLVTDGVFIAIGLAPENEPFRDLVLLENGYVVGADDCSTTAEGIFTAGDCRLKAVRQVATAVSDGAIAALSACAYLDRK